MTAGGPRTVSPYGRPNDPFGYAVYSVVVMATPKQQAKVEAIRDAVRNRRSMIPAHVTVKGTYCEIPSFDEIKHTVRTIAADARRFFLEFDSAIRVQPARNSGLDWEFVAIHKTRPLAALHDRLYEAIAPVVTQAYGEEQGEAYRPHLTVFAEPVPESQQAGRALCHVTDLGSGFHVNEVWLIGHVGPPYRGKWVPIQSLPLAT